MSMITRGFRNIRKLFFLIVLSGLGTSLAFSQEAGKAYGTPDADGRVFTGRTASYHYRPYMFQSDLSGYHHAPPEAVEAFRDMKYGIRIHWGIYSHFMGESWILKRRDPKDPSRTDDLQETDYMGYYHNIYKSWYPRAFDAGQWARMFRENNFRFFVFTAKHHDGFSMYDTRYSVKKSWDFYGEDAGRIIDCDLHYCIMETPFNRDVTAELVEACRKEGLRVGLYFSHPDWFDADFRLDPTNPFYDSTYSPQTDPEGWKRFTERHSGQLKELLTNYGKVDLLSLDMSFDEVAWPYMEQMVREIRAIQPDCMIRWRGIGPYGDYHTPESYIPGEEDMGSMAWQVIHPMNDRLNFSYEPDPDRLYDGEWIVENLVDIVSKGGNFMVGVGPDNTGAFHPKVLEALEYAGDWLDVNGEAIFSTRPWTSYREGDQVRFTRSKDEQTLYIHSIGWPGSEFRSRLVSPLDGSRIYMLGVDEPMAWDIRNGELIIHIPEYLQEEGNRPCKQVYVFRVRIG
jgi:alpha-L-fucosidase